MSNGTHYYYLLVYDLAGNVTLRTTRFTVDTIPPIITNIIPVSGTSTTNKRQSFHADVSDTNLKEARLRLDSGAWIIYPLLGKTGVVNYTPTIDMSIGIHYYYLLAYDLAGNVTLRITNFVVH